MVIISSVVATFFQALSIVWIILFGSLTLSDVIRNMRQRLQQQRNAPPQNVPGSAPPQKAKIHLSYILNVVLATLILIFTILDLHSFLLFSTHSGQPASTPTPSSHTTFIFSTATAQAQATATAQAQAIILTTATGGVPVINDPLNAQDNLNWDNYPPPNEPSGSCTFHNGAYYATATPGNSTSCEAIATNFSDLALQAKITIIHGNAGIIFRSNKNEDGFYTFCITSSGGYFLEKSSPNAQNAQDYFTLFNGNNPSIISSTMQPNVLTVITHGNIFNLYVNMHYVGSVNDKSYSSGAVGVFTNSTDSNPTEAAFTNLSVWGL